MIGVNINGIGRVNHVQWMSNVDNNWHNAMDSPTKVIQTKIVKKLSVHSKASRG
jgi:hypothetical protein